MTRAAFDTLGAARRLHAEFNFPQKQAEGMALPMHKAWRIR